LFGLNSKESESLSKKVIIFQHLKNEYKFKKEVFLKGLSKMELSKLDTLKNAKFMEIISYPTKPENIFYPKPLSFIFSIIVFLITFYGIIIFLINIIKEHKL
jgi:capsule polysaccharide export protein KpsE/RkpR